MIMIKKSMPILFINENGQGNFPLQIRNIYTTIQPSNTMNLSFSMLL